MTGVVMKKISAGAIIFLALFQFGCESIGLRGSGVVKDETREIDSFEALNAGGFYFITVECGKEPSLEITGDDNIIPLIATEVRGNTLHIWNRKSVSPKQRIKIMVTTRNLSSIDASGASSISVKNIDNSTFEVNASGAGKLKLAGQAGDLRMILSGAVNIDATRLKAEDVDVQISGASNADVYAVESLRAEISGVGNIDYYGTPKTVKRRISGLGSITQR